jgi:hypothetical protein
MNIFETMRLLRKLFFKIDAILRKIYDKIGAFPLLYYWVMCHRAVVTKDYRVMLHGIWQKRMQLVSASIEMMLH